MTQPIDRTRGTVRSTISRMPPQQHLQQLRVMAILRQPTHSFRITDREESPRTRRESAYSDGET